MRKTKTERMVMVAGFALLGGTLGTLAGYRIDAGEEVMFVGLAAGALLGAGATLLGAPLLRATMALRRIVRALTVLGILGAIGSVNVLLPFMGFTFGWRFRAFVSLDGYLGVFLTAVALVIALAASLLLVAGPAVWARLIPGRRHMASKNRELELQVNRLHARVRRLESGVLVPEDEDPLPPIGKG